MTTMDDGPDRTAPPTPLGSPEPGRAWQQGWESGWENDQVQLASGVTVPVRATARRRRWAAIPPPVRTAIEVAAGDQVTLATTTGTGFTAGFASRLDLARGGSIFVKAASTADDRLHGWDISAAYRVEARNLRLLPAGAGAIPLLWTLEVDDGKDDWVVLGFPYVAGNPPRRPWRPAELKQVTDRLGQVAESLTNPPAGMDLRHYDGDADEIPGWVERVRARDSDSRWLDRVGPLAAEAAVRCAGDSVAHLDLRDDNLPLDDDGTVWICDWNWPMLAAPWLDLVTVLIAAHGDGLDVDAVVAEHPLTRDLDPRSVDAWLATLWLYFTTRMEDEVPHGSPHLRDHQAWYAEATGDWLRRRLVAQRLIEATDGPVPTHVVATRGGGSDG